MRDRGEASGEVNFWTGRKSVYHFPIVPLADLQRSTSTYPILTSGREWPVEDLRSHAYEVDPLPIDTNSVGSDRAFSALSHASTVLFRAHGDLTPDSHDKPRPFDPADKIPGSLAAPLKP